MIFKDREEAAHLLAKSLKTYRGKNPLVLAIPRGAVPMGKIIAESLGGELDIVLVHKLGHPENPEYAIGAVDEKGDVQGEDELKSYLKYGEEEAKRQLKTLQMRRKLYTPNRTRINPKDRIVIIVDDGIATGWTEKAAIKAVRADKPKLLVVAVAVGPSQSIAEVEKLADIVVCLEEPENFAAVGQFYRDFRQVSDEEVISALR